MAQGKRVYTVERFILLDDTEVEVKPLAIKKLRNAQDKINNALLGVPVLDDDGEPVLDDDGEVKREASDELLFDALFDVIELVMVGQKSCEKFLEEEKGRDLLEDTVDQDTMYEIIRVSTGYDFLAMQKRALQAMEQMEATL